MKLHIRILEFNLFLFKNKILFRVYMYRERERKVFFQFRDEMNNGSRLIKTTLKDSAHISYITLFKLRV